MGFNSAFKGLNVSHNIPRVWHADTCI